MRFLKAIIILLISSRGIIFTYDLKWIYKYYGNEASDIPKAITCDREGNIYSAFISKSVHNYADRSVIKILSLDRMGNFRWEYVYTKYEKYYDDAVTLLLGKDGNLYLLGKASDYYDEDLILVLCLDRDGNELWEYIYSSYGSDFAYCMVYGEDENLYIAGSSYSEFFVLSLTNYGNKRWIYKYKSQLEDYPAYAFSLCYAPDGNIYSAGQSEGNIFIVSLDNSGNERWFFQYYGFFSSAHSICADKDSNIYIFGVMDYDNPVILSFDRNGNMRWEYNLFEYKRSTSGPELLTPILCDGEGNIYTVYQARVYTWFGGIFILSLDTSGNRRWEYLYWEPEKPSNVPYSLFSRDFNNIYVSGYTGYGDDYEYILFNFNKEGNLNFLLKETQGKRSFASCVTEDINGNIYLGVAKCLNLCNLLIVSLDNSGNKMWSYEHNTYGCSDEKPGSTVYDEEGNTYISVLSSASSEFIILCIDNTGKQKWIYKKRGIYGARASCLAFGKDGNLYAIGVISKENWQSFFYIISMDRDGNVLWTKEDIKGSGYAITYGLDGNLYLAGKTEKDIYIMSMDKDGNFRWGYEWEDEWVDLVEDYKIIFGEDGNIYLLANLHTKNNTYDWLLLSLKRNGNQRWVYRYKSKPDEENKAKSMAFGKDGNIYITGYSANMETGMDLIVLGFSSSGNKIWEFKMDGGGGSSDEGNSIIYGKDGNLYIAGYYRDQNYNQNVLVLSLSRKGQVKWVYTLDGDAKFWDEAKDIIYGEDNNLYITGYLYNYEGEYDFFVLSLCAEGNLRWFFKYDGPAGSRDEGLKVVVQKEKEVTVAGISTGIGTNYDLTLIKLNTEGKEREVLPPKYIEGKIKF